MSGYDYEDCCYECSAYGDDYFINDDGEMECYCPYCHVMRSQARYSYDEWDD